LGGVRDHAAPARRPAAVTHRRILTRGSDSEIRPEPFPSSALPFDPFGSEKPVRASLGAPPRWTILPSVPLF
jgi:hypothetical protein